MNLDRYAKRSLKEERTKKIFSMKRELYKLQDQLYKSITLVELDKPVFSHYEKGWKLSTKGKNSRYTKELGIVIPYIERVVKSRDTSFIGKKGGELIPGFRSYSKLDHVGIDLKNKKLPLTPEQRNNIEEMYSLERSKFRFQRPEYYVHDVRKVFITHRFLPDGELQSRVAEIYDALYGQLGYENARALEWHSGASKSNKKWDPLYIEKKYGVHIKHIKDFENVIADAYDF